MSEITELKPDWSNRRKLIYGIIITLGSLLVTSLFTSVILAYFTKFGLYISIFMCLFVSMCFLVILGVIGSYIFGARWETKDFLQVLPQLVPDFHPAPEKQEETMRDTYYDEHPMER